MGSWDKNTCDEPTQKQRSSRSAARILKNVPPEYTWAVCSNHGQQAVNNLNSNACLSAGSSAVYNKSLVLMRAIGRATALSEKAGREAALKDIITFVGRSTKRGEMQRRVAAPQRLSVGAVSELCAGLESLCSPRTWTLNIRQKWNEARCAAAPRTPRNKIMFASNGRSLGIRLNLKNHVSAVQRGHLGW